MEDVTIHPIPITKECNMRKLIEDLIKLEEEIVKGSVGNDEAFRRIPTYWVLSKIDPTISIRDYAENRFSSFLKTSEEFMSAEEIEEIKMNSIRTLNALMYKIKNGQIDKIQKLESEYVQNLKSGFFESWEDDYGWYRKEKEKLQRVNNILKLTETISGITV
jgi:HD superfamily phosphohydrolase